jgi:hypothetical protein
VRALKEKVREKKIDLGTTHCRRIHCHVIVELILLLSRAFPVDPVLLLVVVVVIAFVFAATAIIGFHIRRSSRLAIFERQQAISGDARSWRVAVRLFRRMLSKNN